ncbi:MAG TPA: M28 family peptidase [Sphingomicrobium sp.]|nr:M28 family peptidase [Sphingomicrobium sp.]
MIRRIALPLLALAVPAPCAAQQAPPLIGQETGAAIASEISGSAAKRTVQALSMHHRMRGSQPYAAAAEIIRSQLAADGLSGVDAIALPADGVAIYGTQRSRPAWNARFAELWDQKRENGSWVDAERIASWDDQPITLAEDSVSGAAETELVDVGAGSKDADYAGKSVRGKLVLASDQADAVAPLAVTKYGAAGIVSWAQNQQTAWWGEDQSLIRWGHLDTWKNPTFAFMVSPARAHAWQNRLARGEAVHLRARVDAGRSPGQYLIPTAVIPGRDPAHEIVYSCHLDHPSPGANDNASGCAGILEIARTLNRLVAEKRLPQPLRTIRFIWPCEVECTIALLNARPEFARRTLATIHLDMIGGDTEKTKSILRVEGSPPSLPNFVGDVAFAIARWVNEETMVFADSGEGDWPLIDPEGDKRALQAKVGGFSEGSDHGVWAGGSWRVPVIYVADWPDRYIHTQRDLPSNLDATKMKRAMFIAAAAGWYLANVDQAQVPALERAMRSEMLERRAALLRDSAVEPGMAEDYLTSAEADDAASLSRFGLASSLPTAVGASGARPAAQGGAAIRYRRKDQPKGPMEGFGYSWFDERLKAAGLPRPALLDRPAPHDSATFAYEALNLVDGSRTVQAIRDRLAVSIGSVPLSEVADYLATLHKIGLLERR